MSTSIDQAFITSYESKVHEVFQRRGACLKDAVRMRDNVVGSTASFHKIGKGVATTKARHGAITPMNQDHTAPTCTLADFYAGDWVDKLDEAKTNMNERDVIASGGAMALGRKVDDQITTVLDTTTQAAVTITVSAKANILAGALTATKELWANDVPNDGRNYSVITPTLWAQFLLNDQFARVEYVRADGMAWVAGPEMGAGRWKEWMGVKFKMQTGLPGEGTATAKGFIWNQDAVAYASAASAGNVAGRESVSADITWHGDRAAHFVNHMMSGQACMIDDTGVIEINHNDTAAIATS